MSTLHYDSDLLKMDFLGAADLRRIYAKRYPRAQASYIAVAELLEKLASTVEAVDTALLDTYGELFENEDYWQSEKHQEMLREIGVTIWPENAAEFVRDFIASAELVARLNENDLRGFGQVISLADLPPVGNA
jgi:hypothetical protein